MDHAKIQRYMDHHQFRQVEKTTHRGADIYIAEKYVNHDPEFPEPHIQTWLHVALGEDTPMVGQKLYFRFGKTSQTARIAAAKAQAELFIEHIAPGFERDHGRRAS